MFQFKVHYTGFTPRPGETTQRQWNAVKRAAWTQTGIGWHEFLRPKHFTKEGAAEYGYAPRSGETGRIKKNFWRSYTGRKQKKYGHTLPLVLSGELRDRSRTASISATATATQSVCRVRLPGANKANFRNPKSPANLDMRDELTRISAAEGEQLAVDLDRHMQREFDQLRETQTIIIT